MQIQIHKQKSTQTLSKTQIQIHANANIEAKNIEEKNVCAKQHIAARKRPFPSTFGANVIVSEMTHKES